MLLSSFVRVFISASAIVLIYVLITIAGCTCLTVRHQNRVITVSFRKMICFRRNKLTCSSLWCRMGCSLRYSKRSDSEGLLELKYTLSLQYSSEQWMHLHCCSFSGMHDRYAFAPPSFVEANGNSSIEVQSVQPGTVFMTPLYFGWFLDWHGCVDAPVAWRFWTDALPPPL